MRKDQFRGRKSNFSVTMLKKSLNPGEINESLRKLRGLVIPFHDNKSAYCGFNHIKITELLCPIYHLEEFHWDKFRYALIIILSRLNTYM